MDINAVATLLVTEKATVSTVAQHLGQLGARHGAEYEVITNDPLLSSAAIGSRGDLNSSPQYVELIFRGDSNITPAMLKHLCPEWKEMPTNPGANPFHYVCKTAGSNDRIDVMLYADLTGELAQSSSNLTKLLMQRNVWR